MLERLVEYYIDSRAKYTILDQDITIQKLSESFSNDINKLRENGIPDKVQLWKMPIGRYGNLNGNKRIYPKKLWENVRDNQQDAWKGLCGLCDHPVEDNDPGFFRDQAIVWHDMDIGEDGIVYGIGAFVGPHGKLAKEIIEAGGRVGLSSSGFGEVEKSNQTVNPDTYIIERLADLVLNPSQDVFGSQSCAHTPDDFMKDVHQGGVLEFGKQQVRETKSKIVQGKMKEMADNNLQFNAAAGNQQQQGQGAAPVQKKPQPQNNQQQPQAAQGQQQQPQQQPAQQQESVKMSQEKKGLSKIEEKAFRKYAEAFVADMGKLDNPIRKLEECTDILSCFDEGNCPDLKAKLEESLRQEKDRLEKLVETSVKMEQDFGMDTSTIREKMEERLSEGLYLKDQYEDYEKLVEGLTARNRDLNKEVKRLQKVLLIRTKLSEKTILNKNKNIVEESTEIDSLRETIQTKQQHILSYQARINKLAEANRNLEKENGKLQTQLNKAANLLQEAKKLDISRKEDIHGLKEMLQRGKRELERKEKELEDIKENYATNRERYDKLNESFRAYKQEVQDTYNPIAHIMPNSTERIGKYLNLRENKGIEVEAYWQQLQESYGEAVAPYEEKIRNAKTLQEAKEKFFKFKNEIDNDFKVGGSSPDEYALRNTAERARITEQLGQPVPSKDSIDVEQINKEFLDKQRKQGLL